MITKDEMREQLRVVIGMTREETLGKFIEWREAKKTCDRCIEREWGYEFYCPYKNICNEMRKEVADGSSARNIDRRGIDEGARVNKKRTERAKNR